MNRAELERDFMKCEGVLLVIIAIVLCWALSSCKTVEYITVPEVHEVYHHHTDSIKQTDSVTVEKETVIMQLDSAAMAKYGIQLKAAERAWLVKTAELERRLQQLIENHTDTVHERDSIPVPYPVIKEVEKKLSKTQKGLMWVGGLSLMALFLFIVYKAKHILPF